MCSSPAYNVVLLTLDVCMGICGLCGTPHRQIDRPASNSVYSVSFRRIMPKITSRLLQALPSLRSSYSFSSSSLATYSVGISYAGKDSPPFVQSSTPYPRTGFASMPTGKADRIRQWVRDSGSIPAGRGELASAVIGGWTKDLMERVSKWGAGEDFFAMEVPDMLRSVSARGRRY
jgi:hypothetical protein